MRSRREQKKYHGIIKAVVFLRQYQKEVKRGHDGKESFRYIEVDREDIQIASDLALHFTGLAQFWGQCELPRV